MADLVGKVLAAGGPWAVALAVCAAVLYLVVRSKLIPKPIHDQRMADKQQLVDFYKETANKALATTAAREQPMADLITKMTDALAAHDKRAGS